MRGVKKHELDDIIKFIYKGETQIQKQSLDSILQLARDLGLRGLERDQIATELMETKPNNVVTNEDEPIIHDIILDIGNYGAGGEIKDNLSSNITAPFMTLEDMKINMQKLRGFESREIESREIEGMAQEEEFSTNT